MRTRSPRSGDPRAPGRALAWRVLRDGPLDGARNMALDHALAAELGPDEAVLRLYSWIRPTVSLGRNEPAKGRYATAARRRIDFVRRPTGGRAVMHDAELTYAVVAPLGALGGLREAYRSIHRALVAGLRALGAPVEMVGNAPSLAPDAGPCFAAPARGEVAAAGRKLVGSAQVRVGAALLQHGSVLLRGDQSLLAELSGGDSGPPPATLEALLGPVSPDRLAGELVRTFALAFPGSWDEGEYRPPERATADRLERERYDRASWTWRL